MLQNLIDSLEYTIKSSKSLLNKEEIISERNEILKEELQKEKEYLTFIKGAKEKYQVAVNELYEESVVALQDTLNANRDRCVGMAANMIGVKKRIIIVNMGFMNIVMYNPVIVKKDTAYETEEGCLSLEGVRKTTRYQNIEVEYLDGSWKKHRQNYSGWIAQIIQHEVDHLEGRII